MLRKERKWNHITCSVKIINGQKRMEDKNGNKCQEQQIETMINMAVVNQTKSIIPLNITGWSKSDLAEQMTLLSVSRHHPIHWALELNKKVEEGWINSLLELRHPSSPTLEHWWSWFLDSEKDLTPSAPWFSGLQTQTGLYHQLSRFSSW